MPIKHNLLKSAIMAFALITAVDLSFAESARFEVSNDLLIDHKLGLEWQKLIFNEAGLPDDQQVGTWRTATFGEVASIFPISFSAEPGLISKSSDTYAAFEFFSSSAVNTGNCGPFGSECFTGYAYDVFAKKYSPSYIILQSTPNDLNNLYYQHITTASAYHSNEWCAATNTDCSKLPIFTVRAIPEPGTLSMLLLGFAGLSGVVARNKTASRIV